MLVWGVGRWLVNMGGLALKLAPGSNPMNLATKDGPHSFSGCEAKQNRKPYHLVQLSSIVRAPQPRQPNPWLIL